MASITSNAGFVLSTGLYRHREVLGLSRETHKRDLASRILAEKLAQKGAGSADALYHEALAEAEKRLHADF